MVVHRHSSSLKSTITIVVSKKTKCAFLRLDPANMDSEEEKKFHIGSQTGTALNSRGEVNTFLSKGFHGK